MYIHMSLQGVCFSSQRFCLEGFVRGFCLEGFVRGGFCPLGYNRKVNITFNFRFPMYENNFKSMTSHALGPFLLPPVANCRTFSDTPPSSVTHYMYMYMDGPMVPICSCNRLVPSSNKEITVRYWKT